jgi:PAS domain S-box-containing protein
MNREWTLRELTEALTVRDTIKKENERNFQDIFFLNPIAMIITKIDGTIVKINEALTRVFGYTKDDLYGGLSVQLYKNPEERTEIVRAIMTDGYILHHKVTFVAKDGRDVPCVMSSKLISLQGEPHIVSVVADDTWRICA